MVDDAQAVVADERPRCIEDVLSRAIVVFQHHQLQVVLVVRVEIGEVFQAGTLEFIDGLVVVAYDKNIGRIPVAYQLADNLVLGTVGVLVFIDEEVKVLLLIIAQQGFVLVESLQHPEDHVVVVIAAQAGHGLLVAGEEVGSGTQALHAGLSIFDLSLLEVTFADVAAVDFIDELFALGQAGQVAIDGLLHVLGCPAFRLHHLKEVLEVAFVKIGLVAPAAQGVAWCQLVQDMADDLYPLQLAEGLHILAAEELQIVLDDAVAKRVEGVNVYAVSLWADELEEALPHSVHPGIRKGKAKDVLGLGVGLQQDAPDAGGKDVGFTRARPGDGQYGPFNLFHGLPLSRVELLEHFDEGFVVLLSILRCVGHACCFEQGR